MHRWRHIRTFFLLAVLLVLSISIYAQIDTSKKLSIDSVILRQKGIIGQLAQNLLADTVVENLRDLLRTDKPFQRYKGRIIRHINIQTLEFGVTVADTTKRSKNKLKRLSNKLHRQTRDFVIRNNLFFSEQEILSPNVLADNERHLRDLPFIRDANIRVRPVRGSRDSVDVFIITKDVLSIGGSFRLHNAESLSISLKEDNFFGYGDRVQIQSLFDIARDQKFGYGFEYIKRNIGGNFVDGALGFVNYNKAFSNGKREERVTYFRLTKPLVNRYMKWTFGSEIEWHQTQNFYNADSLYQYDFKYKYNIIDAWGAWNIDAGKADDNRSKASLRRLIGLRVIHQNFSDKPLKYANQYYYSYADLQAVLGSISIFRQDFYKTQFIYGFGRKEDVPEGMEASFTTGWTKKDKRERPFAALNFQRYYFTPGQHYFNYTMRAGSYLYKSQMEDIDLLVRLDYFNRLHHLNNKWKQRLFLSASATKQVNSLLNEPLRLESEYGLRELKSSDASGNFRVTLKGESVFYSPWSVLFFRFAPFVFANAAYINLKIDNVYAPKLYAALGGGVRIRNESLIFGTTEFRGMYFPRKNFRNESWRVEVNTNIRFKYNQEFIKRPEFVRVN
ncbi:MAG: hypothetical protein H7Y07_09110 [Pyrinomonadaceae bacterium]|nr:hypothetical protein [Sphingobacteriaceae bacterium]